MNWPNESIAPDEQRKLNREKMRNFFMDFIRDTDYDKLSLETLNKIKLAILADSGGDCE